MKNLGGTCQWNSKVQETVQIKDRFYLDIQETAMIENIRRKVEDQLTETENELLKQFNELKDFEGE